MRFLMVLKPLILMVLKQNIKINGAKVLKKPDSIKIFFMLYFDPKVKNVFGLLLHIVYSIIIFVLLWSCFLRKF